MAYNTFDDEAITWLLEKVKTNTAAISTEIERAKSAEENLQAILEDAETQLSNI